MLFQILFISISFWLISKSLQKNISQGMIIGFLVALFIIPPDVLLLNKYAPSTIFLSIIFFIGIFRNHLLTFFTKFPFKKITILYILCLFLVSITNDDKSLNSNLNIFYVYTINLIAPFLLSFYFFNKKIKMNYFLKSFTYTLFIFNLYGIITYLINFNIYADLVSKEFGIRDIAGDYLLGEFTDRHQISSFFFHPYMYAVVLYFSILIQIYIIKFPKEFNINIYIHALLLLVSLIALYLIGSRTGMVILFFSVLLLLVDSASKFYKVIAILPFLFIVLSQFKEVESAITSITDIFSSGNNKVTGSNLEMREKQFLISVKYFLDHPYFGNGIYSIIEKIGYATKVENRTSDSDAFGFESYLFVLIIEQGLAGLITQIIFFTTLIRYYLRNLKHTDEFINKFVHLIFIFICGYIFYILGTGTINTLPFFYTIIGLSTGYIEYLKKTTQ